VELVMGIAEESIFSFFQIRERLTKQKGKT
jgi:hypothetical protein